MKLNKRNIQFLLVMIFFPLAIFSQEINPNGFNIFYYENGEIASKGFLKDGKPNGYWFNYSENGKLKSEGNRKDFLLDSTWKFYSNQYVKEIVNYEKNRKKGPFIQFSDSGILYAKSTYVNDTLQGENFIFYPTGELHFKYNYLDGNYHGSAYEYREDSTIISIYEYNKGKLVRREKINRFDKEGNKDGLWKTFTEKGILKEEGEYKNGEKNGVFKIYKYNGELDALQKFNQGEILIDDEDLQFVQFFTEYYRTGEIHFTIAKNDLDQRQGITQEYDKKGNVIETKIFRKDTLIAKGLIDKKGLKQNEWKFYLKGEKVIAKGKYKDDYQIDEWMFYYPTGKIEQKGKFKKGELNGKWVWYYPLGMVHREEYYRKGKENGEFIEYDEEGKIITKGDYTNGLKDGNWFYEVGDHTEKGKYLEGEKDGEWTYFYMTDQLYFKGNYKNGKPIDKHIYYHVNGNKKWTGNYSLGKREGKWVRYSEEGEILVTYTFRNDVLIKTDGKRIKPAFKEELNRE